MGSDPNDTSPKAMVPVRRGRALPVAIPTRVDDDPPPSVRGPAGQPRSPAGPGRPQLVGARSPAETGMLVMTPVGDNRGAGPAADDPSATRFFALPPPPSAPSPRAAARSESAGAASLAVAPTPVVPVITGPVASSATPFPSAGSPQAPPSESRVESWRVAAVVIGLVFLAGIFGITATALIVFRSTTPAVTVNPVLTPVAVVTPPPQVVEEVPVEPVVVANPRPRVPRPTPAPTVPAPVVVPPPATTGSVSISFSGESVPTGVEVVCTAEGFRERKSVSGNRVSVPNVPTGATCQAVPKGVAASNFPVKAGGSYSCAVVGTTTTCN